MEQCLRASCAFILCLAKFSTSTLFSCWHREIVVSPGDSRQPAMHIAFSQRIHVEGAFLWRTNHDTQLVGCSAIILFPFGAKTADYMATTRVAFSDKYCLLASGKRRRLFLVGCKVCARTISFVILACKLLIDMGNLCELYGSGCACSVFTRDTLMPTTVGGLQYLDSSTMMPFWSTPAASRRCLSY